MTLELFVKFAICAFVILGFLFINKANIGLAFFILVVSMAFLYWAESVEKDKKS